MPGSAGGLGRVRLALLASLVAGASLSLAVELAILADHGGRARATSAFAAVGLVIGAVGLVIAALLNRNDEARRRHAERLRLLGDPTLDALDDGELLTTIATRLREALAADEVAVLLRDNDRLGLAAGAGLDEGWAAAFEAAGFSAPTPAGLCQPVRVPAATRRVHTAWAQAVSGAGTTTEGLVYVGWTVSPEVTEDDRRVLTLAAERVWSVVHRRRLIDGERLARLNSEGARRQLSVLAYGGQALTSALRSYDNEVAALAEVFVPAFADLCAIDLMDDGGRLTTVVSRTTPHAGVLVPTDGAWRDLLQQVLVDGHTCFGFTGPEAGDPDPAHDALQHLRATSALIVPVRAGGLSLGTITMATGGGRRGFRTSDVAVAEDLAARLGLSVQRVLLYRQLEASAEAQSSAAARLRRLTDAAITLAASGGLQHLLDEAAAEAQRVVRARAALVLHCPLGQPAQRVWTGDVDDEGQARAVQAALAAAASGTRVLDDSCCATPLLDSEHACRGALVALPRPGERLDADDEAALVSLAHLVALVLGRAELTAALAEREARLNALVDAAPLAILRLFPDGEVQEGNRGAAELFQWPPGSSIGPLPDAVAGDLLHLTMLAALGVPTSEASIQWKVPDGEILDINVAAAPVRNGLGQVEAVLLLVADVSERRRAERQLELAQRLEAMGQVAGGVAHDFNNLLTVIVGYTEALLGATDPDDPTRPLLESIERAGASAAALTRQLLGLAGRQEIEPVPLAPERLVHDLEPVLRRLMGLEVQVELRPAGTAMIIADPAELERLFLNLAINARDAMPNGGRLIVSMTDAVLDRTESETRGLGPGRYVVISVADTGTGMDDETRARCFEPFFTTKERGRGTGLGLAGVYSVAQEAGGTVEVTSTPGEGARFDVWLPSSDWQPSHPGLATRPEPVVANGRVLLVEDEEEIRELACHLLEQSGFTVVTATGGTSALAAFQQRTAPFDVLVTDIVMSGMRGTELASRLQAVQPSLQVLYVSGYTGTGSEGDVIFGNKVLRKPFRSSDLISRVARLAEVAADASST